MRLTAVVDGTGAGAQRQGTALGAFMREGLAIGDAGARRGDGAQPTGDTVVFYEDPRARDGLVELAPMRDVRLVRMEARRSSRLVDLLSAQAGGETDLFLFAGGPEGTELATRLASRSGGSVLTDVLSAEAAHGRLRCRRQVYSGHLMGRFDLRARPWCVAIDASWADTANAGPLDHAILSDTDEAGSGGPEEFADCELVEAPATSELGGSRVLVVAGSGAGSRQGVERIAEAARRMGAAFGVTRPVAMSAWSPMDRLIGVSGTRTAPALCIVAGASGAPAFFWGVEKAGFIVAVDLDERAPIVRNADAVLLDDAVAVLEELATIVAAGREQR